MLTNCLHFALYLLFYLISIFHELIFNLILILIKILKERRRKKKYTQLIFRDTLVICAKKGTSVLPKLSSK